MKTWKASVCVLNSQERWHTEVKASDKYEALKKALDIFLATEDREDVEFDYSTIEVVELNRLPTKTTI